MAMDPTAAAVPAAPTEPAPVPAALGRLSARMVGQLAAGEQFVVWAMRQRLRDGAPTSPVLVHGFRLAFGLSAMEPALAAFEGCFAALARHAAEPAGIALCPLRCACLTADEETILGLVAAAQLGQPDPRGARLVATVARPELRRQAAVFALALLRAGLALPLPLPSHALEGGAARVH